MNNVTLTPTTGQNLYRAYDAKSFKYSQQPPPQEQDELSTETKAVGSALILRGAQWGLEQLSKVCASTLMAGKEFASADVVKKAANAMKSDNGLKAEIHYIDNSNKSALQNAFPNLSKELDTVANAGNAFYTNQGNFAVAPKSKPSLILHELGHATNFEKSSIMRGLQRMRIVGAYAPMAIAYMNSASHRNADGKKNFWERNAGILGFCAFLPTIIEEAAASIRGINSAKKTLGAKANLKALKKNYFFAWLTYVLAGVGVGIASKLAIVDAKAKG